MRPVVRPGAVLLRRDQAHLQFGVEPGRAVVVRDSTSVRDLLAHLDGLLSRELVLAACSDHAEAAATLDSLVGVGVVVDADEMRSAPAPAELAHLLGRQSTERADKDLRARAAAAVGLDTTDASGTGLAIAVGELLAGSGVGRLVSDEAVAAQVARRVPPDRWRHSLPAGEPRPDVVVLVGSPVTGPDTERLAVAGVAHLALSVMDGIAVVGPFVRPGATACVACVDETLAARDPAWPALVDQLRPAHRLPTGPSDLPPPRSRVLEGAVAAWAAREVLAHLAGAPVLTYGASLRLDDGLVRQVVHRWALHPACACSLLR